MHDQTPRRKTRRHLGRSILFGALLLPVLSACELSPVKGPQAPDGVTTLFIDPAAATLDASAGAGGADFQTFKVTHTGTGFTGLLETEIRNEAGTPDFEIITDTCNDKLLTSHFDCDITVAYNNASGTGQGTAELVVSANPGGTVKATLTGNGVA